MARYLVEARHTPEECLQHQDEILARGPEELAVHDWSCLAGEHTAYVIVEADGRSSAADRVPPFLRHRARIVELSKITPEQVQAFHRGL